MKKRILELLEENSKIDLNEIALILNSSEEEVGALIKEMEEEKIILKYDAVINWEKANFSKTTARIDVKVMPEREVGFEAIAERIYRFPEVKTVSLMSGEYDLSLTVEGESIKEIATFVTEKLSTIEQVKSTMSHFVMKNYKKDGVIFEDGEKDRRQVVTA